MLQKGQKQLFAVVNVMFTAIMSWLLALHRLYVLISMDPC